MVIHILSQASVLTFDDAERTFFEGSVVFDTDNGKILDVGLSDDVDGRYPEAQIHNYRDRIVMPGMVNTHTHLFQTMLKGLGADKVLSEWFTSMTGPMAVELTWEDCYAAALHGCTEALTTGTTTLVDFMYVHPQRELADAVVAAMKDSGIRGVVARGIVTAGGDVGMPAPLIQPLDVAIEDASRLIAAHNCDDALVNVAIAPCMSWSIDETTLRETRRLADATGALITMHLAESDFDVAESKRRFGCGDTELLERTGLLGPDLIAVHCVKCDEVDLARLAAADVAVSHNPCSNLYLGSGVAPVPAMLAAGLRVSLATDGPASSNNLSMLQALKFASLVPKGVHQDPRIMTGDQVLRMATRGGASAVGLENRIGSLEVGKDADIIALQTSGLSISPVHDPVASIVYSHRGDEVQDVWINGRMVVADGSPTLVDAMETRARCARSAYALAARAGVVA